MIVAVEMVGAVATVSESLTFRPVSPCSVALLIGVVVFVELVVLVALVVASSRLLFSGLATGFKFSLSISSALPA